MSKIVKSFNEMFHSVCTLNFIATLLEGIPKAKELIKRSFLEDTLKEQYRNLLDDRSRALENESF